jgi:hypothetical protein
MKRLKQKATPAQLVEQLKAALHSQPAAIGDKEINRAEELGNVMRKHGEYLQAMLLAALDDRPVPIALFKPWCSYPPIRNAEIAGKLTLERRNGKVLVTPSDFFAWFNTLPTKTHY